MIKNQVKYNLTGNVVRKRLEGDQQFKDYNHYVDELERVLRQDIEKFPVVKVQLMEAAADNYKFNRATSVFPMPCKLIAQPVHYMTMCPCFACRMSNRGDINTVKDPTDVIKVANIELMQKRKDTLRLQTFGDEENL